MIIIDNSTENPFQLGLNSILFFLKAQIKQEINLDLRKKTSCNSLTPGAKIQENGKNI